MLFKLTEKLGLKVGFPLAFQIQDVCLKVPSRPLAAQQICNKEEKEQLKQPKSKITVPLRASRK